jgi:hypothetical protein
LGPGGGGRGRGRGRRALRPRPGSDPRVRHVPQEDYQDHHEVRQQAALLLPTGRAHGVPQPSPAAELPPPRVGPSRERLSACRAELNGAHGEDRQEGTDTYERGAVARSATLTLRLPASSPTRVAAMCALRRPLRLSYLVCRKTVRHPVRLVYQNFAGKARFLLPGPGDS